MGNIIQNRWRKLFKGISPEDAESCETIGLNALGGYITEKESKTMFEKYINKYGWTDKYKFL